MTLEEAEIILRPLKTHMGHIRELHEADPENPMHEHVYLLLQYLLRSCEWEAETLSTRTPEVVR